MGSHDIPCPDAWCHTDCRPPRYTFRLQAGTQHRGHLPLHSMTAAGITERIQAVNWHRTRVALGTAATAIAALSGAPAAGATTMQALHTALPRTLPVSCTSNHAWLRLRTSAGEHCYTGNGSAVVDLAGVRMGQIAGVHTVCLFTTPSTRRCITGPATFGLTPPAYVRYVTIRTP